jgi:hypothetical protein
MPARAGAASMHKIAATALFIVPYYSRGAIKRKDFNFRGRIFQSGGENGPSGGENGPDPDGPGNFTRVRERTGKGLRPTRGESLGAIFRGGLFRFSGRGYFFP